ncbi:hypothetical protein GGR57DRAFT_455393 [Xylariaceae sp. FL1272]|nr:hypothetical protein GGR57DRAFT_455393 [Xylariaceae sp. FL1272]
MVRLVRNSMCVFFISGALRHCWCFVVFRSGQAHLPPDSSARHVLRQKNRRFNLFSSREKHSEYAIGMSMRRVKPPC